jgi:formate-dependent nitrite reductase cytochrome c552 subunit
MRSSAVWLFIALLHSVCFAAELVTPDFVGPEGCKGCHLEAYNAWKQSKHARAMDSLSPAQQQDVRCISCHAPHLKDQKISQVSCESCHGGGQYYSATYVMKDSELARLVGLQDPSEKGCRSCHDASSPSLKPFEFAEKLKLIDHWTGQKRARSEGHPIEPVRTEAQKK